MTNASQHPARTYTIAEASRLTTLSMYRIRTLCQEQRVPGAGKDRRGFWEIGEAGLLWLLERATEATAARRIEPVEAAGLAGEGERDETEPPAPGT